ncbi:MAG: metallophosphoesterase [Candidatus Angelobacter sp.]
MKQLIFLLFLETWTVGHNSNAEYVKKLEVDLSQMGRIGKHTVISIIVLLAVTVLGCGVHPRPGKPVAAPAASEAKDGEPEKYTPLFRFIVYGDTRTNHLIHQEIVQSVLDAKPDFILQTGDLVQFASLGSQWGRFDRITKPIRDKNIPYYPARGNHDSAPYSRYTTEVRDKVDSGNKLYYRFDRKALRFICLDTETAINEKSPQYHWLESELQQAKLDGKIVVPFFHEAIFSAGKHAGENRALRSVLHPLFIKYGVKVVFQGHDHLYYRTSRDSITYVVTGGGGAPLYDIQPGLLISGDVAKKLHHFCIADVFSDRIDVRVLAKIPGESGTMKIDEFSVALNLPEPAQK